MQRREVLIIQTVTCVYPQTERVRLLRAGNQSLQFSLALRFLNETFRELSGMQFDELAANARRRFDLFRVRRDEQADFDAGVVYLFTDFLKRTQMAGGVQSA